MCITVHSCVCPNDLQCITHTHTHTQEASTSAVSVFKVTNSTPDSVRSASPPSSLYGGKDNAFVFPRGPDIFTWAVTQQISHDHSYCKPETAGGHMLIERGTVNMKSVPW